MFGPKGGGGGGNQFCRGSAGLLEVANVFLAICAVVHVDDTIVVDTEEEVESARGAFVELSDVLQCSQKRDKSFPPRGTGGATTGPCLGVQLELPTRTEDPEELCVISLPEDKARQYEGTLRSVLSEGACQLARPRSWWAASNGRRRSASAARPGHSSGPFEMPRSRRVRPAAAC